MANDCPWSQGKERGRKDMRYAMKAMTRGRITEVGLRRRPLAVAGDQRVRPGDGDDREAAVTGNGRFWKVTMEIGGSESITGKS